MYPYFVQSSSVFTWPIPTTFRSQEFLSLLGAELSVGGDSWEKQLEPVVNLVKDLQDDPKFLEWIKFLVR